MFFIVGDLGNDGCDYRKFNENSKLICCLLLETEIILSKPHFIGDFFGGVSGLGKELLLFLLRVVL